MDITTTDELTSEHIARMVHDTELYAESDLIKKQAAENKMPDECSPDAIQLKKFDP